MLKYMFIAQIIRLCDKVGSLCRLQCPHCRKSEAVDGYKPLKSAFLKAYLFFGDHNKIIPSYLLIILASYIVNTICVSFLAIFFF